MKLVLQRTYHENGTNGILYDGYDLLCFTIELPWKDNLRALSCIPEGAYFLARRFSKQHQYHLQVMDVPGRDLILVHKANNAMLELKGCIAPVQQLIGQGKGYPSAPAFNKIYELVDRCLANNEKVELVIEKAP